MTDIAVRPHRPGFFAGLIARFLAWMDEPVVLQVDDQSASSRRDRSDLPVHHPLGSTASQELWN